jgi:hypothetical protein
MRSMPTRILLMAVIFLAPTCFAVEPDTGPDPDVKEIHDLVDRYAKAVDTVD